MQTLTEYIRGIKGHPSGHFYAEGPEQENIHRWLKKHPPLPNKKHGLTFKAVSRRNNNLLTKVEPESWELNLFDLDFICNIERDKYTQDHYTWEFSSKREKAKYLRRISSYARQLADALEEEHKSRLPMYDNCFLENYEVNQSEGIFNSQLDGKYYLRFLFDDKMTDVFGFISDRCQGSLYEVLFDDQYNTSMSFENTTDGVSMALNQYFPKLLRNLAESAEEMLKEPPLDSRPSTGHSGARILTRRLAKYFSERYRRTPNNVIASLVTLTYPELDPPPSEDTIRDWRRAK